MSLGENIRFICPSETAFGEKGSIPNRKYGSKALEIPPNTDIGFDMTLMRIFPKDYEKQREENVKKLLESTKVDDKSSYTEKLAK
jgi:hypothetical protein